MFNSTIRRKSLLELMQELEQRGINCYSCQGDCCSFIANSIQVTPLEALELFYFLSREQRWNSELWDQLKRVVHRYRLDVELRTKHKQIMRKTYTCPFYSPGKQGCSIAIEFKPYGCLGFNPLYQNCTGDGGCKSYIDVLKKREADWIIIEDQVNNFVKEQLELDWDKLDISRALLQIKQKENLISSEFLLDVAHKLEQ